MDESSRNELTESSVVQRVVFSDAAMLPTVPTIHNDNISGKLPVP
jgi:hypothetical protein